jgi:cysteine desulfurase/selenocysteine lyase
LNDTSFSTDELNQYRNDTAGCSHVVHLNNAGAAMPPNSVVDTVVAYLKEEALYGGYETEYKYFAQLDKVYDLIAKLVNAHPSEIAIYENAGTAWGVAFKGLQLELGDEIITSEMEYTSSVISLINSRKAGVKVTVINNAPNGKFPLDELESAITKRTKLITVAHIASSGGGMLPIEAIGRIANSHNIIYMVDACQSAGQYPLDVKSIGCDIMTATGRKYIRGPRGTAFLFVRQALQDQITPFLADDRGIRDITTDCYTVRQDAKRYELYEKSRALTLGLGAAVSYILDVGIERIWARVQLLATFTRQELRRIPGLTVYDSAMLFAEL